MATLLSYGLLSLLLAGEGTLTALRLKAQLAPCFFRVFSHSHYNTHNSTQPFHPMEKIKVLFVCMGNICR